MAEIVLRVRLTGGEHMDITYEEPDTRIALTKLFFMSSRRLRRTPVSFSPDTVTGLSCCTAGEWLLWKWRREARSYDEHSHTAPLRCSSSQSRGPLWAPTVLDARSGRSLVRAESTARTHA